MNIVLPDRFWAKVEKTPTCWLWTGEKSQKGYGVFRVNGKARRAHRLAYEAAIGPLGDLQADHTCFVHRCVNPSHLRPATPSQNQQNREGAWGSSQYRGVYWEKRRSRWVTRVVVNGKVHLAGSFTDEQEAAEAVRQLRLSLMTHNIKDRLLVS